MRCESERLRQGYIMYICWRPPPAPEISCFHSEKLGQILDCTKAGISEWEWDNSSTIQRALSKKLYS